MAPVSAVKSNSLFKYIRKEKKKDQCIVISSDEEESDDEIPAIAIPVPVQPVSSGQLNDPIDLDSDTESMEKCTLSNIQTQVTNTHVLESIAVPTPESVLSEPTSLYNNNNSVNEYQQDDVGSFGSPMNQDLFQDFQTESIQASNLNVPHFATMQTHAVTQMDIDVDMAEPSPSASLALQSLNNTIKRESPFSGLNDVDVPELSNLFIEQKRGHKRVLELAESSTALESNLETNNNDIDMEEEDDLIDINALRLQAPKSVKTKKYDMSLSEVLGTVEIYLQSVTEAEAANDDEENKNRTRHTRRAPRHVRTGTPPFGEFSQVGQAIQGSFCDFPLQRPYMPTDAWYNCTWEDWAQFNPGDILHVPFSDEERRIVEQQLSKHQTKKTKMSRSSLDIWQIVERELPGRTAQDCKYYSYDLEENKFLHNKPVMIRKPKKRPISRNAYSMVRQRRFTGAMGRNSMKLCQWMNLSREDTISGGSGDALSLAIYRNPRTKNMCVAAGSLCDENVQYNLPGNLRVWDSVTDRVTPLPGHKSALNETQHEEIWRTVTDVKMSRDGSFIISASHDGSAKVWKSKTGKIISTLCYHEKPINQLAVNNCVRDNVLATCSNDGSATIWTLSRNGRNGDGKLCDLTTSSEYNSPIVECIQFGRDHTRNQLFMGICNDNIDNPGYVTSFDSETAQPLTRYRSIRGSVCAIDISSTGQYIASGNYSNADGTTGDRITHIHDHRYLDTAIRIQTGHGDVNVVSFSPCERFIASGNADKENAEVVIFDIRYPGRALHTLSHSCSNSAFLSPDSSVGIGGIYWMSNSKQFVSGGGDSKVKLWNLAGAGELLKSYETTNCVTSLAVDEDCMTLAAGVAGAQGVVHVWQP